MRGRVLITAANGALARTALDLMGGPASFDAVRAVDVAFDRPMPEGVEVLTGDLRDRAFAESTTDGMDAVLHLVPVRAAGQTDAETVIDSVTRGSYNLIYSALNSGVRRFLLGSTLATFDRLPAAWKVDEAWRPRPTPDLDQLAPWLAELSLREFAHTTPIRALCLRFGALVTSAEIESQPFDPRWLHINDAARAIACGVAGLEGEIERSEWNIFHIASGERAKVRPGAALGKGFGYVPEFTFAESAPGMPADAEETVESWKQQLAPPRPIGPRHTVNLAGLANIPADKIAESAREMNQWKPRHIVIFGSGGPVAAALADELKTDFILRQTDVRPLAEIQAENNPQSPGAPLPVVLDTPHEMRVVDVRDYSQVLEACRGMDAIINCTVVRPDPVDAFRVNTLGAYNVARAAVAQNIRRVVQTGPQQVTMDGAAGYHWDYDLPGDVPPRPGRDLYAHSKYLGQEIIRVFADYYDLEVPVLLFTHFIDPETATGAHPWAISWRDSARAIRAALEVPSLPSPYEVIHILTELPHGRYRADRAKALLGWTAQDDLMRIWSR